MGQLHTIPGGVAPPFAHAVETFLFAHVAPGAWSSGTATKYRQTLTALAARAEFQVQVDHRRPALHQRHAARIGPLAVYQLGAGYVLAVHLHAQFG